MNLLENIREGLRSIISNRLRTILTSLIIAIGITSLVGILTAIDGMQSSVDNSFAGLGANTFDIEGPQMYRRFGGRSEKRVPPIDYHQAMTFKRRFQQGENIAVYAGITGAAQIKYATKKTKPNVQLIGIDDNYIGIKALVLQSGRNFSATDLEHSLNVTIVGSEIASTLFDRGQNPLNKEINVLGGKYKVVGVLEKKGGFSGGGDDRKVLVPLENARAMAANRTLTFDITGSVPNMGDAETAVAEARGLMRQIRQDPLGKPDTFEIKRADELAKDFENITSYRTHPGDWHPEIAGCYAETHPGAVSNRSHRDLHHWRYWRYYSGHWHWQPDFDDRESGEREFRYSVVLDGNWHSGLRDRRFIFGNISGF
jgi:putative ABC transport system permease protein